MYVHVVNLYHMDLIPHLQWHLQLGFMLGNTGGVSEVRH
jgi:hypothetical protein